MQCITNGCNRPRTRILWLWSKFCIECVSVRVYNYNKKRERE